jgi:copper(I)-binding protein
MRRPTWCAAVVVVLVLVSGCGSQARDESMAAGVTVGDQWVSAADTGMAAMFGTLTNAGAREARIISGSSPAAGRVEVHEVVPDVGGSNVMQPKAGGIAIPADGAHDLTPGGDHVMLMDLTGPLRPGADVEVVLTFEDGSTLPVTAQARDFPGADEEYQHG